MSNIHNTDTTDQARTKNQILVRGLVNNIAQRWALHILRRGIGMWPLDLHCLILLIDIAFTFYKNLKQPHNWNITDIQLD